MLPDKNIYSKVFYFIVQKEFLECFRNHFGAFNVYLYLITVFIKNRVLYLKVRADRDFHFIPRHVSFTSPGLSDYIFLSFQK